jgi:hypothetical protein
MSTTFSPHLSSRRRSKVPWGLQQEELLRRGLASDPEFQVVTSANLDHVLKTDLVVRNCLRPELAPIGVQVTTRRDAPEKLERTFQVLRTTRAFARSIYLILAVPAVRPAVILAFVRVLREVAAHNAEGMFVVRLEEAGGHVRAHLMQTMLFNAAPFAVTSVRRRFVNVMHN